MFENTPYGGLPGSLNQPAPAPGLPPSAPPSTPPPAAPPTPTPPPMPQPSVHTMPERFRSAGGPGGGPSGSKATKKLVIVLVVVVVLAGLSVGGLYVFQQMNQNANNQNNTNVPVANLTNNTNTAPANQNLNLSTNNVNENLNTANVNSFDSNTNTVVNTNTVANFNSNTNTNGGSIGTVLPSSADADADGLTDIEEAVYGTNATLPDSDNDTFIDGKQVRSDGTVIGELYNGYNPAGAGRLEESTLVRRQANASQEYSVLVPAQWTATTDSSGGILIEPNQPTGETIQFRINDNPNRLSSKEWYKSISPQSDVDSLTVISVNGLEALYTEDLSTIYFFKDTKVYSLQYLTGSLSQVNFRTTVDMMVRSFTLGG